MLYIALHVCAKIETYLKIYMKNKKKGRNSRNQNNKTENRSKLLFNVNKICFFFSFVLKIEKKVNFVLYENH